jgi:hypothetical protein
MLIVIHKNYVHLILYWCLNKHSLNIGDGAKEFTVHDDTTILLVNFPIF